MLTTHWVRFAARAAIRGGWGVFAIPSTDARVFDAAVESGFTCAISRVQPSSTVPPPARANRKNRVCCRPRNSRHAWQLLTVATGRTKVCAELTATQGTLLLVNRPIDAHARSVCFSRGMRPREILIHLHVRASCLRRSCFHPYLRKQASFVFTQANHCLSVWANESRCRW